MIAQLQRGPRVGPLSSEESNQALRALSSGQSGRPRTAGAGAVPGYGRYRTVCTLYGVAHSAGAVCLLHVAISRDARRAAIMDAMKHCDDSGSGESEFDMDID